MRPRRAQRRKNVTNHAKTFPRGGEPFLDLLDSMVANDSHHLLILLLYATIAIWRGQSHVFWQKPSADDQ